MKKYALIIGEGENNPSAYVPDLPGCITTGRRVAPSDKVTGKEVGAVAMPNGQTGIPMTYLFNEKQYIVIAIGGQGFPAELPAFKSP